MILTDEKTISDDYNLQVSNEKINGGDEMADSLIVTKLPQIPEALKRSKLKLEQSSHILKNLKQRSSKNNNRNMINSYIQHNN